MTTEKEFKPKVEENSFRGSSQGIKFFERFRTLLNRLSDRLVNINIISHYTTRII